MCDCRQDPDWKEKMAYRAYVGQLTRLELDCRLKYNNAKFPVHSYTMAMYGNILLQGKKT